MGGTTSKFGETDWDTSDGGLTSNNQTVDGGQPTTHHTILHLLRPGLVNQREFTVRDFESGGLLYTSEPVDGTSRDFDLFSSAQEKEEDPDPVLRVHAVDSEHTKWQIMTFSKNWEDQLPEDPTKQPLYRKLLVEIHWDSHYATVSKYTHGDAVDARGVISEVDQASTLLKVEDVASITTQYQSMTPTSSDSSLCGYWVWEHTPTKHQIKLHLSKNSDKALHCLLAIITNQVDIEKKAVAS